MILIRLDIGI